MPRLARAPIYVRQLTDDERAVLKAGLCSREAFVLRRCQILLASASGKRASQIGAELGCDTDTALNAINAFNRVGLECLTPGSPVPDTIERGFDAVQTEALRALLHQSPRNFGKEPSLWTLELAAEVSFEQGLTPQRVSREAVRTAVQRLGVGWKRAKQPSLYAWAEERKALRLIEQTMAKDDPDRKALACYGLLVACPAAPETLPEQIWLRLVEKRPVSAVTTQYLAWCCEKLQRLSKKVLLMIWDNVSWHISKKVRDWLRSHNREVRRTGQGVRIVPCHLPIKSPWLNRIEPHWVHGKRKVVEPAGLLSAQELANRICAHFGCDHEPHLTVTVEDA